MARQKEIYLVATYLKGPRKGVNTGVAGYLNNDKNISYQEKVVVTRGLKDRDVTADIILNLTQKTVFKNRFGTKNVWETLAAYYSDAYPQYFKVTPAPDDVALKVDDVVDENTQG
ncbi:MAG: hypothetical protein DRQ62_10555 [Gammaproteobacteria bacterium]|nr:MAG: hypothetical protein DRQ62_10555 [Gammaproteobacteria bacterium]